MYYTVSEVAELLKVKKAYVYDIINYGKLKAIKLSKRRTRILSVDLDDFMSKMGYNNIVQSPQRGKM